MKISVDSLKTINRYSRTLLNISACIYSFAFVVYILVILFQQNLIPLSFEQDLDSRFIFPVINFLGIAIGFVILLAFCMLFIYKKKTTEDTVLELIAMVLVSLFNIIFPILMNSLATEVALLNNMDYYLWYNRLIVMLGFTKFFIPFSIITFNISLAMRITLKTISVNRIE